MGKLKVYHDEHRESAGMDECSLEGRLLATVMIIVV